VSSNSAKPNQKIERPGSRDKKIWEELLREAESGIEAGDARAYARNVKPCGPTGILSSEVYLRDGSAEEHLLCMALFPRRRPHYRPWMELFCIRETAAGVSYFGSEVEDKLLEFLCKDLGPGCKIFIEYYHDRETHCGLSMGFPPAVTRQGYKLFRLGFTWFKDWYFSEGGHEGGQKLQGERPLDNAAKRKHMQRIKAEVESFLERPVEGQLESDAREDLLRAKERARVLLAEIDSCQATQKP
jgi:hypothetical protein